MVEKIERHAEYSDKAEAENKRLRHRVWLWKKMATIWRWAYHYPADMVPDIPRPGVRRIARAEAERDRLRAVVVQARETAIWFRQFEPYVLSPRARKQLTALEAAASDVLNDGKGDDACHEKHHPVPVASVAPPPLTTATMPRDEYLTTVAAIVQRLSGKPESAQAASVTTTNESSPSEPSTCSCAMAGLGCDCSRG